MRGCHWILCFMLSFTGHATHGNPLLPKFGLIAKGGDVVVYWTTARGFTCEDLKVEFATDTNHFITLHNFPGICGSESVEQSYQFAHRSVPVNTVLYYRIDLGQFGKSGTERIRLFDLKDGLNIIPHPALPNSLIHIRDAKNLNVLLNLYDFQGRLIFATEEVYNEPIDIQALGPLREGCYLLEADVNGSVRRKMFWLVKP